MQGLADQFNDRGITLMLQGNSSAAMPCFQRATQLDPCFAQAHSNLGMALNSQRQFESAIAAFQRAILLQPNLWAAHLQLGDLFFQQGQIDLAEPHLKRTVEIQPESAEGWNQLGNVYRVQQKMDSAIAAFERAITIKPQLAAAYCNLGNALKDIGQIERAIVEFRKAVALDPASAVIHSNLVYAVAFHPDYDSGQILNVAREWADRHARPRANEPDLQVDCDPHRRRRIGYLSPDFRDHVVGRNVLPVLQHHNRQWFEVHCFSTLAKPDEQTRHFQNAADAWHECAALNDVDLAVMIRASRIDILVDLSLHMAGNRATVFARRLAPVQVTWAGYPGTTGMRAIDYRISDSYLDPDENAPFYAEKTIRVPHSFWCYRPAEGTPEVNASPALSTGRITFGCLNNFGKVTATTIGLWISIMSSVPNSRMIMLCPAGSHRDAIRDRFNAAGIDPSRIDFHSHCPVQDYLRLYHQVDIALDPFPYTGHSTTLDSLWMGVPVVTLSGRTSVARGSVTALTHAGLGEFIAHSPRDYVAIAIHHAADVAKLASLRGQMRQTMQTSHLCDETEFTGNLEMSYRQMWHHFCNPRDLS